MNGQIILNGIISETLEEFSLAANGTVPFTGPVISNKIGAEIDDSPIYITLKDRV